MKKQTFIVGLVVLVGMATVQILWHLALDMNTPPFNTLRSWYLTVGNLQFRKAPIAVLVDGILPPLAFGIIFGIFAKPKSLGAVWMFAISCGVILPSLQMLYPHLVSYELWWLDPKLGNPLRSLLFYAASGTGFSFITAYAYYKHGQGK